LLPQPNHSNPSELLEEKRANAKFSEDPSRFRDLFDRAVLEAEEGATYLYSCDQNQAATDDDEDGGLFTFNFLKAAREWRFTSQRTLRCASTRFSGRRRRELPRWRPSSTLRCRLCGG